MSQCNEPLRMLVADLRRPDFELTDGAREGIANLLEHQGKLLTICFEIILTVPEWSDKDVFQLQKALAERMESEDNGGALV